MSISCWAIAEWRPAADGYIENTPNMGLVDKFKTLFKSDKLDVDERFSLLNTAVSGTMSSVFMAKERNSDRVFGLKLCDSEKLEQFESRFKGLNKPTEGEIAVKLKNPRIV